MDMFDRFMDTRTNVRKEQLQLLGVTCLFIASKIEVSCARTNNGRGKGLQAFIQGGGTGDFPPFKSARVSF